MYTLIITIITLSIIIIALLASMKLGKTINNRHKYFNNEFAIKVIKYILIILICFIGIIYISVQTFKSTKNADIKVDEVSTERTTEGYTESIEDTQETEEISEEVKLENELLREIELLRSGDDSELTRWFGDSKQFKGIESYISQIEVEEVNLEGFSLITVYDDNLEKETYAKIVQSIKTANIGMTDIEIEAQADLEFNNIDKDNFYKTYNVKVERQNGLVVITEELKNIITNDRYIELVVNGVESEALTESTKETSLTNEIMNRGN